MDVDHDAVKVGCGAARSGTVPVLPHGGPHSRVLARHDSLPSTPRIVSSSSPSISFPMVAKLHGLVGRSELNGAVVVVLRHDPVSCRYIVATINQEAPIRVKNDNLEKMQG